MAYGHAEERGSASLDTKQLLHRNLQHFALGVKSIQSAGFRSDNFTCWSVLFVRLAGDSGQEQQVHRLLQGKGTGTRHKRPCSLSSETRGISNASRCVRASLSLLVHVACNPCSGSSRGQYLIVGCLG